LIVKICEGTDTSEHLQSVRRPGRFVITALVALAALLAPLGIGGLAAAKPSDGDGNRPTIVLLHGDWADASSWNGVIERLQRKHFNVVAPPNPLRGPTSDASYVASFLQSIPGPIVLVAHSYGGFVATNAAAGNPNVKALVYVDAFIPDEGQTLADLTNGSCVDPTTALNFVPVPGGVIDTYLRAEPNGTYEGFSGCFANGVDRKQAAVLQAGQRPAALNQFVEPSGPPAWKTTPSWSLIGTEDHVIPPAQQQAMSTRAGAQISTVDTGHLSLIIRPDVVTKLIQTAVTASS
jgi:pimeloyl-ACP methyl ester carboxylesterase